MTCEQCKYHSYIGTTHFCDSRNHKRKTVWFNPKKIADNLYYISLDEESEE